MSARENSITYIHVLIEMNKYKEIVPESSYQTNHSLDWYLILGASVLETNSLSAILTHLILS